VAGRVGVNAVANDDGSTALMYLCENGINAAAARLFLDRGADVNVRDGTTAFMYLCRCRGIDAQLVRMSLCAMEQT
jgi:ankyrin repeat protein